MSGRTEGEDGFCFLALLLYDLHLYLFLRIFLASSSFSLLFALASLRERRQAHLREHLAVAHRRREVARKDMGLVAAVADQIADQQVRNRGTIGGSLAHGDAAADFPAMLLAFDGTVTVRGPDGEREIAAGDMFEGYLTTAVRHGEVLTEVRLPVLAGYG